MKLFCPCDVQEKIRESAKLDSPTKNVGVKQQLEKIGQFEPKCLMFKKWVVALAACLCPI
jgi:hypothetical protein